MSPHPATTRNAVDSGGFGDDMLVSWVVPPPAASRERSGHGFSFLWAENRQEVLPWTNQSRVCLQFNVKKSTEPVQPRALLKLPDIYGPRPAVTAPEVINYADYTLRTTEEPAAPASPQAPNDSRLKRQVTEELFILPQNGRAPLPLVLPWPARGGANGVSADAGPGPRQRPWHLTLGKHVGTGPGTHDPFFLQTYCYMASLQGLQLLTGKRSVLFNSGGGVMVKSWAFRVVQSMLCPLMCSLCGLLLWLTFLGLSFLVHTMGWYYYLPGKAIVKCK